MEFLTLHAETGEMVAGSLHPGITRQQVCQNTHWEVRFAETVVETEPPSAEELEVPRELRARTAERTRKRLHVARLSAA